MLYVKSILMNKAHYARGITVISRSGSVSECVAHFCRVGVSDFAAQHTCSTNWHVCIIYDECRFVNRLNTATQGNCTAS